MDAFQRLAHLAGGCSLRSLVELFNRQNAHLESLGPPPAPLALVGCHYAPLCPFLLMP